MTRPATFRASPMSRRDLEALAERYLRAFYPENLLRPATLDVIGMMDRLEDTLGVIFGVADLDPGEEGMTDPVEKQILVASSVYEGILAGNGRDRQTACHEVGHIHHIRQVRDIIRDGGPQLARRFNVQVPPYANPEWQAHGIGSALLMPRTTTPIVYKQGGIDVVAEFFQVSYRNAEVRISVLRDLGVL